MTRIRCVDFMELYMKTASLHIIYTLVQGLCLSMDVDDIAVCQML